MAKKEASNENYDSKMELYDSLLTSYKELLRIISTPISEELNEDKRLKAYEIKEKIKKQAILAEVDLSKIRKELFENYDETASVVKEGVEVKKQIRKSLDGDVEKRVMQSEPK